MTRKQKNFGRLICLLLCVIMLPNMLFLSVSAANSVQSELPQETEQTENTDALSALGALYEVEELRTPTEKHYRMPDGSYTVVKYSYDVHYEKDGVYEEYDNTLVSAETNGEDKLVPKNSNLGIAFSENAADSNLFTVAKDGKKIGFAVKGADSASKAVKADTVTKAAVTSSELSAKAELEERSDLKNTVAGLNYGGILPYTDINYEIYGGNVKESIVLSSPLAGNKWEFFVTAEGLSAEKDNDGNILFKDKDTGETVYHIPKGYMFDDSGAFSNDVEYNIESVNNGYVLSVTASAEWLCETSRVYPVTVDPTLFVGATSSSQISDTYIVEGSPSQVSGAYHVMITGYDQYDSASLHEHILLKINSLPVLPLSAVVVDATYRLQQLENGSWYSYSSDQSKMHITAKKNNEQLE